jgi:hypothetical protein
MRASRDRRLTVPGLLASTLLFAACTPPTAEPERHGEAEATPVLTGEYLGQSPPGMEPVVFAPGLVSTGMAERDLTMTPEGNELYFTRMVGGNFNFSFILVSKRINGRWTTPEVAPFSGRYKDLEPAISPDGKQFFFLSFRPLEGSEATDNEDIWVMERTGEGWGEPRNLGPPVNSEEGEFFPSVTNDGTLYFTRRDPDGTEAIFRSRWADGAYLEPQRLPEQVNSGQTRFNAFIAPDESFLIVPVWGRDDSLGGVDYYAVFRSPDDSWSDPVNMGERFNTDQRGEWSASLSPDGEYLFFMSSRSTAADAVPTRTLTAADLQAIHNRPQNGHSDIWWVDARVIDELRSEGY